MSERRLRRTPGGVCSAGQHVVWCLRYRRQVLGGRAAVRCDELVEQMAAEHRWQTLATEVMPDHVPLFGMVGPVDAPVAVIPALMGRMPRVVRQEFGHMRRLAKVFWSPSFFAAAVGYVSESRVRGYLGHRWDAVES